MIAFLRSVKVAVAAVLVLLPALDSYAMDRAPGALVFTVETTDGASHGLLPTQNWGWLARYEKDEGLNRPVLALRPAEPLLCASRSSSLPARLVAIDPNGYLHASSSNPRAAEGMSVTSIQYGSVEENLQLGLEGLNAVCINVPVEDVEYTEIECNETGSEKLFSNRFESKAGGSLEFGMSLVTVASNYVIYEYIFKAVGGPVMDLQFREQFPYHLSPEPADKPFFARSFGLYQPFADFGWRCDRSDGAVCTGKSIDVTTTLPGYASLDGASLEEGACLKVTGKRVVRSDGLRGPAFSGRMYGAAFYSNYDGQGQVQRAPATVTRIRVPVSAP